MEISARLRGVRVALALVLMGVSGVAYAADEAVPAKGAAGFVQDMRQTLSDTGLPHAVAAAAQWVAKAELSVATARELRPSLGMLAFATATTAALPIGEVVALHERTPQTEGQSEANSAPARQKRLSLADISRQAVATPDRNWVLSRSRSNLGVEIGTAAIDPATYLTTGTDRGPAIGSALAEHSLAGHDIELGWPMPSLPQARISAGHYWWGDRAFTPEVQGNRVSLSYAVNEHLQFEGGGSQDTVHGSTGFFGLRYNVPLDTDKLPGVMPR